MRKLRRIMLWLGLIFIIALTIMSIYGAFLGAADAQIFFNSMPLPVYWAVFAILIAVSLVLFPRMLKAPGLFAMHLGCVLIIAGSMWGSQAGHEVQRKYFGSEKVQSADMSIVEGSAQNKAYMRGGSPVNQSFADIEFDTFKVKYSSDSQSIDFIYTVEGENKGKVVRQERVMLGNKIELGIGQASITPSRLIDNLVFKTVAGKEQAVSEGSSGSNPALEITFVSAEGVESTRILADTKHYGLPVLIKLKDFRIEYYPQPKLFVYDIDKQTLIWSGFTDLGTEIDLGPEYGKITPTKTFKDMVLNSDGDGVERGGSGSNPAVEIQIELPDKTKHQKYAYANEDYAGYCKAGKLDIYYSRTISDYISELDVLAEDGTVLKSKDIEVNDPLWYEGYHFYQSSYHDFGNGQFATILSVTSDSGLFCVFAGFFAMCGGIIYHQWLGKVGKKRKQKPEAQG